MCAPALDENQEKYSEVSVVTSNEDFTQSVKSRNLYSYGAEDNVKADEIASTYYKVCFSVVRKFQALIDYSSTQHPIYTAKRCFLGVT